MLCVCVCLYADNYAVELCSSIEALAFVMLVCVCVCACVCVPNVVCRSPIYS